MAGSELPRRRSPRHSGGAPKEDAHAENVLPSPAATPSKPATTPTAAEAKENVASATPSSILKRRRRSILSEVSKVDGKSPGGAGRLSEAARKKRKQSLASRRVSFAVESALESVREFQKDERDADKAFPDPSAGSFVPPKPPSLATTATCPPPAPAATATPVAVVPSSPFGAGPASAAAEAAMAAFSPAATPVTADNVATPRSLAKPDPFAAFGVSDSPAVTVSFGSAAKEDDTEGTPITTAGVSVDAMKRVSNASDFIPLGTPASAAPSSAARSAYSEQKSALSSASPAAAPSPGSMFTAHLPRRVTMDPAQYRDAMRAAVEDASEHPTEEPIAEEEEEEEEEEEDGDGAFDGAITAAVPGLSALADEDEDDFGDDEPGENTMNMLEGMKASVAASPGDVKIAPGDITAAVPGLSALADADDDDDADDADVAMASADDSTASAEKSPAIEGLPMGSVTEDVAANLAAELAAAVAADNEKARVLAPPAFDAVPVPETTEEFAFSAALRESEAAAPFQSAGRKSLAKKRRMTLGVRHDVSADAVPSPATEALPDRIESAETAEDAAMDLNLSDSFEVPPGADAAAASVVSEGLTTHERLFPEEAEEAEEAPPTEPTSAPSSDAFSEPGTDTMNMLAKMKDDTKNISYDAASLSDPAATAGGDTAMGSLPVPAFGTDTHSITGLTGPLSTGPLEGSSAFKSLPATTPSALGSGSGASPYSSEGTVTPANPTPASDNGSEGDGFTPGPDTLLMMEKLKGRKHGDAALDSVRRTIGRPSLSAHAWVAATPLPPIGAAMGAAFTPGGTGTIAGGARQDFANARSGGFGFGSAPKAPFGAFGDHTGGASPFAPGASQRLALRSAKKQNDALALGLLGLPLEAPPVPAVLLGSDARPVELREFFHACEVSFMDAKNLRRKSLAMTSLCAAPPPETVADALKLVCLTAPVIEAMDPMHDHLNDSLASLANDIDRLRGEVEQAQPPLLRLAASRDPAHGAALRDAGKMLKKQCQLAAKEDHATRRLATERAVAASLRSAKAALEKVRKSLRDSREVAAEAAQCADTREVDLKRRIALTGDAATRDAQRMRTREGALLALAERRARVERLRAALCDKNASVVAAQRRRGEAEAEIARAEAALADARAAAAAQGDTDGVLADGGAARRDASAKRVSRLAERARRAGDALRVANRVAPWTLEKVTSGSGAGAELVARVGRLFRVAIDLGTGAGRVTLCADVAGSAVTPAGGAAFAAAVAGAPRAWSETSEEARGGDVAAVLQSLAPELRRAESLLAEAEQCRAAFPRITKVRCTAGGDMELTFVDFQQERKVEVALTMARGAYPRGALRPRVAVTHAGKKGSAALPACAVIEAAIERVPAGEASRRLLGVCRLVDWIVARGEQGMGDAAREAAIAARAPAPAPPPDVFLGAEGATLPAVARRGEGVDVDADAASAPASLAVTEDAPGEAEAALEDVGGDGGLDAERLSPAGGSGRADAEATAAVAPAASPVGSAPTDSPGSEWAMETTDTLGEMEVAAINAASDAPAAKTPAGFQKGSNPLFDDSDEETDAGEGHR